MSTRQLLIWSSLCVVYALSDCLVYMVCMSFSIVKLLNSDGLSIKLSSFDDLYQNMVKRTMEDDVSCMSCKIRSMYTLSRRSSRLHKMK